MSSDRTRHPTTEIDALTPDSSTMPGEFLTLFASLFSIGTGIALFTAPTGAPVPIVSLAFIAAGLLFWSGAALGQRA